MGTLWPIWRLGWTIVFWWRKMPLRAVSEIARFPNNPGEQHWIAAKRILCYLKKTSEMGLEFRADRGLQVKVFSNSASGCCVLFGGRVVSWFLKRQSTVALSIMEAELMALTAAIQEALWLKMLLLTEIVNGCGGSNGYCFAGQSSGDSFSTQTQTEIETAKTDTDTDTDTEKERHSHHSRPNGPCRSVTWESREVQLHWTPLHEAAWGGHSVTCSLLLDRGANPNARDRVLGPYVCRCAALGGCHRR